MDAPLGVVQKLRNGQNEGGGKMFALRALREVRVLRYEWGGGGQAIGVTRGFFGASSIP